MSDVKDLKAILTGNPYPGRGIIIGQTPDETRAVICYFIMGRSDNSRNRVFTETGDDLMIEPYDSSKVEDPSLIIYYPIRSFDHGIIVTNGDQTDTIYDHISGGDSFENALRTRTFEPDDPNWTPRISGIASMNKDLRYKLSILKAGDPKGSTCVREFFEYESSPGKGHFIHTYQTDGDPLPTFSGEPVTVSIHNDIHTMANDIWDSLDGSNRISLYVRYTDLRTSACEKVLFNKHEQESR